MRLGLRKMRTEYGQPVRYRLLDPIAGVDIDMNACIGTTIRLEYLGAIHCVHCQRKTKKSFHNGYCYPCFTRLAETDTCILRPETCHFAAGSCRDESFAGQHCFIPHVVYLADSSSIKVGVTREHQKIHRWMDQGANSAVSLWRTQSRKEAGLVEVFLKDYVTDKTNWRNMLKGKKADEDLYYKREELLEILDSADLPGEMLPDEPITEISYPVQTYPEKIQSLSLEKLGRIEAKLEGIRGQYLLLDIGVINLRNWSGYQIDLDSKT